MGMRCYYDEHEMENMNFVGWLVINIGMELICMITLCSVGET